MLLKLQWHNNTVCSLKQAVITSVNAKILNCRFKKNLDVIEKERLQIHDHYKRIVLDATILARK